ncbi:hypothetical protein FB45DRAFT_909822 [Roridomyces roridus]|uniref:Uncharacterized protein n=1 Tax=Roridomyces roridus TaxID=1738132 RepID=A0AAD7FNX7_9AGAR|nr:hypothetical protein FB45DRAFT_909822 [Roridomyces roridus]
MFPSALQRREYASEGDDRSRGFCSDVKLSATFISLPLTTMSVTRILLSSSLKPVRYIGAAAALLGSYSITQLFSEPAQVQFDTPPVVELPTIFQPPPPPPPPPTRPTASGPPSRTILVQAPTPQSSLFIKDASPPSPPFVTILIGALVILSLSVCVIIWTRSRKPSRVDESAQYDDGEEDEAQKPDTDGLEVAPQSLNDAPIINQPIEPDPSIEPPGVKAPPTPVPRPIIVEIIRGTVCFIVSLPVIMAGVALFCLLYLIASEHDTKAPPKSNVPAPPPATRKRIHVLPGVMSVVKGVFFLFICSAPIAEPRLVLYANAVVHPPALPLQWDRNQPTSESVAIVLKALVPCSAPFVESLLPPLPPPPPPPAPVASYPEPAPPPAPGTSSSPTPTAPDAPQPVTAPPPAPAFSTRHEMGVKLLGILSTATTNRLERTEDLAGHEERLQHIQQRVSQTIATRASRPVAEQDAEEKDAGHADRLRLTQHRICQTMATRVATTDERIRREKIEEVQRRIRRLFGELR